MKKYLVLASMFFVSACAQGPIVGDDDCTYHSESRKNYRAEEVRPQPAPAPVVVQQVSPCARQAMATAPVVVQQPTPCNGCQPTSKTTREPVEIVYKITTYTTTYQPQTTSNVTYEREPIKDAQVQTITAQPVQITTQPVATQPVEVIVQRPATKEVIVQQPTVSRVIEKQVTQEPVKISVEEIK